MPLGKKVATRNERMFWASTLLLALFISACTVVVNVPQGAIQIYYDRTSVETPTPTHEPTPTQESAYTPAPTWTPAPDVFVVYEVTGPLNVRTGAGVQYEATMQLQPGDLIEADPRISIEANGYTWFQMYRHSDGVLLGWSANHRLQEFRG